MKNKYMHRSHISERKFREPLSLFAADPSATWMAEISGMSRPTVSALLSRVRERVARLAETPFTAGEIEIDESYFGAKRVRGAFGKTKVFGMLKRGDKVYTQVVRNCSAAELVPIIKKLALDDSTIYSDEWKAYDGLVNAGYKHHYRVKRRDDVFANAINQNAAWISSDPAVATVSGRDLSATVAPVSPGTATITVTTDDGGHTASCTVTATPLYVPVAGINLDKTSLAMRFGDSDALIVTVLPENATNKAVA